MVPRLKMGSIETERQQQGFSVFAELPKYRLTDATETTGVGLTMSSRAGIAPTTEGKPATGWVPPTQVKDYGAEMLSAWSPELRGKTQLVHDCGIPDDSVMKFERGALSPHH